MRKRPDGATQITWTSGRLLLWDFTCPDTLAPSHKQKSSFLVFGIQDLGGGGRCRSTNDHKILRIVTNTLLSIGSGRYTCGGAGAEKLLKELGRRMAEVTQEEILEELQLEELGRRMAEVTQEALLL